MRSISTTIRNSHYILLYLIWPFSSLLFAIRKIKSAVAPNLIWLFCIYYAFSLSISNKEMDANRLVDFYLDYQEREDFGPKEFLSNLYNAQGWTADVALPIIQYSLSRLGASKEVYFAFLGLVFGYFYSRNILFLSEKLSKSPPQLAWLFFVGFALVIPFWYINGFRFWTASHIFLLGTLHYLENSNRKYLLLAGSSLLVHFSFFFPVIVLGVYLLLGNRLKIYFAFFLISTVLSGLDLEGFRQFATAFESYLPTVVNKKVSGYSSEQYLMKVKGIQEIVELNWYARYREPVLYYTLVYLMISVFIKFKKKLKYYSFISNLFSFILLFWGSATLLINVPSGGRFMLVAFSLALGFFVLLFQLEKVNHFLTTPVKGLCFIFVGIYVVVEIRNGFDTISLDTLLSNPLIIGLLGRSDISLIEIVKRFLS